MELASIMASATGGNATSSVLHMVNSTFVINIVGLLQRNMEFKNFIFYISQRLSGETDAAAFLMLKEFWHNFTTTPFIIVIDNPNSMLGFVDMPSLCVIMTTKWNDPIMKLAAMSLNRMRYVATIFLYFPLDKYAGVLYSREWLEEFYENINLLYEWVWARRFLNTMLITINNNIYLYDAYPFGTVVNKTSDWQLEDFLPKGTLNLKGWNITTPVRFDIPRVFCMRRSPHKSRSSILSGTSGKLFGAFVKTINGTFNESSITEDEFEPFNARDLLEMVENDDIEISVHSFSSMFNISIDTSYPIGINDWCLMVPFRNNSLESMFLQKSFQPYAWLLVCFAALYITVGIWCCTPAPKRDLSLSFLESIAALLLISSQRIIMLPNIRLRFLFVLLFLLGFCLTNVYLTKMAMRLTAASDENQINSIQDVVDANLKIMVSEIDYQTLFDMNLSPAFLKLLIPAHERVVSRYRQDFNTTYGYTITTDRWNFLNKQQVFLKKPLFRLTSTCIGPFYHVFPLAANSDLTQPLMEFMLDVQQSGLTFYWETEAFNDALFLDYVEMLHIDHQFTPLSFNFFRSLYCVWFLGMLLAGLTFMFEIVTVNLPNVRKVMNKWL